MSLARRGSATALARIGGRACSLGAGILIARRYGPDAMGSYALALAVSRLLGSAATLGQDLVTQRRVARLTAQARRSNTVVGTGLLITGFAGLSLVAIALLGALSFGRTPVAVVVGCASVIPYSLTRVVAGGMRGQGRFFTAGVGDDLLQPLTFLLLLLWVTGTSSLFAAFLLSFVAALAFTTVADLGSIRGSSREAASMRRVRAVMRVGVAATLSTIPVQLVLWSDRLIVAQFGTEAVGLYHAAAQLAVSISIVFSVFNTVLGTSFAGLWGRGHAKLRSRLYAETVGYSVAMVAPIAVFLCCQGSWVLSQVYGSRFTEGTQLLMILTAANLANVLFGPVLGVGVMLGRQGTLARTTPAAAMLGVLLMIGGGREFGAVGVAWGVFASNVLMYGTGLMAVRSLFPGLLVEYRRVIAELLPAGVLLAVLVSRPDTSAIAAALVAMAMSGVAALRIRSWKIHHDTLLPS